MTMRAEVVLLVRSYIGTPFVHRGRLPGVALDCAGLLICAARELDLVEKDFDVPPYTMASQGRSFMEWCNRYMTPVSQEHMRLGDVIVLIPGAEEQHLGILGDYVHGGFSIIHASNRPGVMKVIETRLMFARGNRFGSAFCIPGLE